jgi:hypothetical protein
MENTPIKHVLPALVPELSYADLAIHEGGRLRRVGTESRHRREFL